MTTSPPILCFHGDNMAPLKQLVSAVQRSPIPEVANDSPDEPLVSVLVPTYQHEAFIAECLDGILKQVLDGPFEVLVGEDASNDRTRDICLSYAARFPDRLRLFLHDPTNKIRIHDIATGRFNLAFLLSMARGEFVCLCEGDDYWRDEGKLRKQYETLRANPGTALVFSDAFIVQGGKPTGRMFLDPGQRRDLSRLELATGARIPTQSVMFRNVLRSHPIPAEFLTTFNGDTFLFSYLSCFGGASYLESVEPGAYRVHHGGMWSALSEERRMMLAIDTKQVLRRLHRAPEVRRELNRGILRILVSLAKFHWKQGRYLRALLVVLRLTTHALSRPRQHAPLVIDRIGSRLRGIMGWGISGQG